MQAIQNRIQELWGYMHAPGVTARERDVYARECRTLEWARDQIRAEQSA